MFDRFVEGFMAFVNALPILFADKDSPNFTLIRTMLGLLLIIFVIYLIALRPFRSTIANCIKKVSSLITRNS
jgi:hypothetical protein